MKERPIIFSTDMVLAILEGRKTQTRRIIKPQPLDHQLPISRGITLDGSQNEVWLLQREKSTKVDAIKCPYGQPGNLLWVRETFLSLLPEHITSAPFVYKANAWVTPDEIREEPIFFGCRYQWKPSIYMPKKAARIWLVVTNVRVERVQDITEKNAKDEGSPLELSPCNWHHHYDWFKNLWNKINGDESWKANPWVWVVDFEVLSTTGKPDFENVEWLKKVNA